jgi:hypothetical protein
MSQSTNPTNPTNTSSTDVKPADSKTYNSWVDCYQEFIEIMDRVLLFDQTFDEHVEQLRKEVNELYAQHKGEPVWDKAYELWCEPEVFDETSDEASPILK